jgi:sialate O-acetylesterase
MRISPFLCSFFLIFQVSSLCAGVKLPGLFQDHMVLQRQMPVVVWGWAAPREQVTVEFAGQKATCTADDSGSWKAELPALEASAEARPLTVRGATTVTVNDVLVGEVWLCSGQSNMEWALGKSEGGTNACATTNPLLRLCTIPHNGQLEPQSDVAAKWVVSGDPSMKAFSAIGWWFGDKLQKELKVPVAILNDSYGGTKIQSWMPLEALAKGPWPRNNPWNNPEIARAEYERKKAELQPAYDKYLAEKAAAAKNHQPPPEPPKGWPGDYRGPGVLWNGMIHPLLPLRFRGVCWYQGESNAYIGSTTYGLMLPVLIAEWRRAFGQPDLPFLIFQLARNRKGFDNAAANVALQLQTDPNEASWIAAVQEAQLQTVARTPHTSLIVTEDLGEMNVHYKRKEPAATRAVAIAQSTVYGRGGEEECPVFGSLEIKDSACTVRIAHGQGLSSGGKPPKGFAVAGEDRKFVFADAVIDGETVKVSSPAVPKPVAVRYAWGDMPDVNVVNGKSLPLSPFRTDDWPLPEMGGTSGIQPARNPPPVPHP